jgi:pimeloyl-[acyl-carrier protein] methyl ester esterase
MKPLVLLHGFGFHSGIWQDIIPLLEAHFKITLIDLPGYGKNSQSLAEYNLENVIEIILQSAPAKAIYLGWSLGGVIATAIALKKPARVAALINVASSPCFLEQDNWPGMQEKVLTQFTDELIEKPEKTLQKFFQVQLRQAEPEKISKLLQDLFQYGKPSEKTLRGSLEILKTSDFRNQLQKIACPKLYFFGRLDRLVPYAIIEKLPSLVENAQFEFFRDAGHAPFLSHPQKFVSIITEFAKNVSFDR